jgi:hypothetical protein
VYINRSKYFENSLVGKADSPKVAAVLNDVKRIKVSPQKTGRLYPSLTDIESVTETENESRSATPSDNSSFENSIAESGDANTSFGRDILRVVCKDQTHHKVSTHFTNIIYDELHQIRHEKSQCHTLKHTNRDRCCTKWKKIHKYT